MTTNVDKQQGNALPMIIVAGLFFILGFATWLNGSLMPYLQQILQLTPFEASLILFFVLHCSNVHCFTFSNDNS
jgi:fucose permease